ncbi:hypothetical protein BJX96DRAFT_51314 [Aspergillus floccosus]
MLLPILFIGGVSILGGKCHILNLFNQPPLHHTANPHDRWYKPRPVASVYSATVPVRRMRCPGKISQVRYMSLPLLE